MWTKTSRARKKERARPRKSAECPDRKERKGKRQASRKRFRDSVKVCTSCAGFKRKRRRNFGKFEEDRKRPRMCVSKRARGQVRAREREGERESV
eukprot:6172439-Pleurochrysis_carterae.AAC.1